MTSGGASDRGESAAANGLNEEARNIGRAGSGRALITPSDSAAATNVLTTGITLKRGDETFSFDFDEPGDKYESLRIVYAMLGRARPGEDLSAWEVAEERGVIRI